MKPVHLTLVSLALACNDYNLGKGNTGSGGDDSGGPVGEAVVPSECSLDTWPAEQIGVEDTCVSDPGGFTPVVEWDYGTFGQSCMSLPVVADLTRDGMPEIIMNRLDFNDLFGGTGALVVLSGDGSGVVWSDEYADLGYGSPPAVADIDGDGNMEIAIVREYANSLYGEGDYTAALYDAWGNELWESEHFTGSDFDYATSPSFSDMDHDGSLELILGRVILNAADGTTRGVGNYGRGSYGITSVFGFTISECSVSAVADLDLDGTEEVIVGDARYTADGATLKLHQEADDAMIGIANLDDDPEGEIVACTGSTVRAVDTDGSTIWGPIGIPSANILSPPAIADLDLDGYPEIVVAGGNSIWALNHDGTTLWTANATDESGATGASIFDFEGDGWPEVVYIDEVQMVAFDGATGDVKFYSSEHASATMFDYPVIADVDGDDQAEIVVCHNGHSTAMSVYGDQDESWATARKVWNQHAYGISNVNDDGTIPTTATPSFEDSNTWHSAIAITGEPLSDDVAGEILEVCEDCEAGWVFVSARLRNVSSEEVPAGTWISLYVVVDGSLSLLEARQLDDAVASGWTSEALVFEIEAGALDGADAVQLRVDDDGTGGGQLDECAESNNEFQWNGPFCE